MEKTCTVPHMAGYFPPHKGIRPPMSTGMFPDDKAEGAGNNPHMAKPAEILAQRISERAAQLGMTDYAISNAVEPGKPDIVRE